MILARTGLKAIAAIQFGGKRKQYVARESSSATGGITAGLDKFACIRLYDHGRLDVLATSTQQGRFDLERKAATWAESPWNLSTNVTVVSAELVVRYKRGDTTVLTFSAAKKRRG